MEQVKMIRGHNTNNKNVIRPKVNIDAFRVKRILEASITDATFVRLIEETRETSSLSLKMYLFYLITFDLVSYNGEKKVYRITNKGSELLSTINDSINTSDSSYEDIVIYH